MRVEQFPNVFRTTPLDIFAPTPSKALPTRMAESSATAPGTYSDLCLGARGIARVAHRIVPFDSASKTLPAGVLHNADLLQARTLPSANFIRAASARMGLSAGTCTSRGMLLGTAHQMATPLPTAYLTSEDGIKTETAAPTRHSACQVFRRTITTSL